MEFTRFFPHLDLTHFRLRQPFKCQKVATPGCGLKLQLSVRGSMLREIFLNCLSVSYAIFHITVVFGWSLLLFAIFQEQVGIDLCPVNPLLPIFAHGLSGISIFGIAVWLFGYLLSCSQESIEIGKSDSTTQTAEVEAVDVSNNVPEQEEDLSSSTLEENIPRILITAASYIADETSNNNIDHDDDSNLIVDDNDDDSTAELNSINSNQGEQRVPILESTVVVEDDDGTHHDEVDDDDVPLIVSQPGSKFKPSCSHIIYLVLGLAHFTWIIFGTAVAFPMFFSRQLYKEGMDPQVCNETLFWFSFLMVIWEYLILVTLVVWFAIDVLFARIKKDENGNDQEQAVQVNP